MRLLWIPFIGIFLVQAFGVQNDPVRAVPSGSAAPQPYDPAIQPFATPAPTAAPKPIALRIVGSNVKNAKGEYLGRIEDVILNPDTSQIEYALVDTGYPANTGRVVAVPWQLLNYVWDQSQVGGLPGAVQLFRLDIDKARLAEAPAVEKNRLTDLLQPEFRQQLLAFYGANIEVAQGATGSGATSTTGSAAGGTAISPDYASLPPGFYALPGGIVTVVDTNVLNGITNAPTTATNPAVAVTTNLPNAVFTPSNIFSGTTNPFPGTANPFQGATTNAFRGGTNFFPGGIPQLPGGGTNFFPGGIPQLPGGGTNILVPAGMTSAAQAGSGRQSSAATAPTPNPGARARSTSPWMPVQNVVIPSVPATSGQSSDSGSAFSSATAAPTPVIPLQPTLLGVPSPVVPITPTLPAVPAPVAPFAPTQPAALTPFVPIVPTQPAAPSPRVAAPARR